MGFADTVTKIYMKDNSIFADAFNYLIYHGDAIIDPDQLKELDTTEIALPFGSSAETENTKETAVQKYRDILKSAVVKQDETAAYILLGIENQTEIHYAMPVRAMIYDALQYGKQTAELAAKHRREHTKGQSRKEYLSGFYKEDKLIPVITLVIHFGAEEWDAPLSLHEMMAIQNPNLLRLIQNYQIHLIDPAKLTTDDLEKFSTSLREVMGYIKYSKNKDALFNFLTNNPRVCIEANAARVIQAITKTPIKISENAEVIDMCKAIEDMIKESTEKGKAEGKAEGRAEGKAEGRAEGKAEGRAEGKAEGITEGILKTLSDLVQDGLLSIQDAAFRANMKENEFQTAMKKFTK